MKTISRKINNEIIKIRIYNSAEEIVSSFFNVRSLKEVKNVGGFDIHNREVETNVSDMIEGIKYTKCWGFHDSESNTISIWFSGDCDLQSLIELLSHERAHMVSPIYKDEKKEEFKANSYGEAARFAYELAKELKETK